VGLVYIALAGRKRTFCERRQFFGSRQEIRSRAASTALDRLRLLLIGAL
jgi:nicotinamide mononucleotide (NMN) deamidase PncC